MNAQPDTAAYHALLIGINDYPDKPLKGCVSDVYYIKSHLEDTLGDAIQIHLLIAGIPAGQDLDLSAQNSALWPSYHNVISALRNITTQSKEGDCVYIHYSGHGTQDPEDGDLALVLLNENLGQPQIELLWTDVLANMVQAMVDKGLRVTLALDCCFSGGIFRGDGPEEGEILRFYPYDKVTRKRPASSHSRTCNSASTRPSAYRDLSALLNWQVDPNRHAILAACGANETAKEPKINGQNRGLFSYFLLDAMKKYGLSASHADIFSYLSGNVKASGVRRQNPWRAGNRNQAFFGRQLHRRTTESLITVLRDRDGTLELQAGQAHGICAGDEFSILPASVALQSSAQDSAIYKVLFARPLTSVLVPKDDSTQILSSGRVWMARPLTRLSLQRFPVWIPRNLPAFEEWITALQQRSLQLSDFPQTPPAFEVALIQDGGYRILNGSSEELLILPSRAKPSISDVVNILEHLARYQLARTLVNQFPNPIFTQSYEVYMQLFGKRYEPGSELKVSNFSKISLVVRNLGNQPIYMVVLNFRHGWQVNNLFNATYNVILPRSEGRSSERTISFRAQVPDEVMEKGQNECKDVLRVMLTSRPTSFELLELDRLGEVKERLSKESSVRAGGDDEEEEIWSVEEFCICVSA